MNNETSTNPSGAQGYSVIMPQSTGNFLRDKKDSSYSTKSTVKYCQVKAIGTEEHLFTNYLYCLSAVKVYKSNRQTKHKIVGQLPKQGWLAVSEMKPYSNFLRI